MSLTSDEILTQPATWQAVLALTEGARDALTAPGKRMLVIGCGTSAFVAESFAHLREQAGFGVTDAAYASEPRVWRDWDVVVALSRSGTTTEVLDALDAVPAGVRRVGVTGVAGTPIDDVVDELVVIDFANEESVVQTRFPTTLLTLARACFGEDVSGTIAELAAMLAAPLDIDITGLDHFVYLGRGWTRGLAQEAALKIREAAQSWSESYPLLDYRHGPLAVAHPGSLVWMLGEGDDALAADIEATGAHVVRGVRDPLVDLVQAQRLAVACAERAGLNPDSPRHLTRSVILP